MLVYTFRTFPKISELPKETFIFSKLKTDFEDFKQIILNEKPNFIIGLAATDGASRFEPVAINKFGNGFIVKDAAERLGLFVPDDTGGFIVASQPTSSFCNWTMFKIQNFIDESTPLSKLIFIHLNMVDMKKINSLFKKF